MKEEDLQIQLAYWMRYQYPKILWWHTPNEGKFPVQFRIKRKKMGVRNGIPDIYIMEKTDHYHSLGMELKVGKNDLTDSQRKVLKKMKKQGAYTCVCRSFDEATSIIKQYLKNQLIKDTKND